MTCSKRGLARSGRADDRKQLAFVNTQRDAAQRVHWFASWVHPGHAVELEHGGGHAGTKTRSPAWTSPVIATQPSSNTPASTPTKWDQSPVDTSTA